MSLGPLFVGQTPTEPALITVTTPAGTVRNLADYTAEGLLFAPDWRDVSAGSFTQIADAAAGLVQFDWPVPSAFDGPGIYILQIELTTAESGFLDFTTTIEVEVLPALPPEVTTFRVDAAFVSANTGQSVSSSDIALAQSTIGLFAARDFGNDDTWADITTRDQYWVRLAIAHQSAWARNHPADTGDAVPMGAVSVKAGDVSISYGAGGARIEGVMLSPLAQMALKRVAWIGNRTVHATPFLGQPRQPLRPMWEEVSRGWAGLR